ncbi:hypothetical protein Naga_101064g1 [Nannochloropsis gaditana]|uniref:Uncharacterized protein n=1 Tax=Nannochloropsis gaditana TaxID=72520 RepID=W7TA03_9STRA|nr:hypothetical protein Naga_101064g1 [Nannochloropsis gaditana]
MRTAAGLILGLGACLAPRAHGEKHHDSRHAMDFLKMVEAQAKQWEERKLQLLNAGSATKGMGALVGAISSVSQASTSSGGVGKGGLLSGPMAGNVLQNALGGGGDKSSLVGLPAFTGTVDTTATGTGEVYKPALHRIPCLCGREPGGLLERGTTSTI